MVSDGQTVHFWPHSVIHNQKAVHLTSLKLWWKVIFWPPLKRQNFRDASGLNCYPHPISCHTISMSTFIKKAPIIVFFRELLTGDFGSYIVNSAQPTTGLSITDTDLFNPNKEIWKETEPQINEYIAFAALLWSLTPIKLLRDSIKQKL